MSYTDKYKERTPEETIKILTNFFEKRNLKLDIEEAESDIGTFSCLIKLLYKDVVITYSNGKGMSRVFSLASGLAELYERFCNFSFIPGENNISTIRKSISLKDRGFSVDKTEQDTNFLDAFENLGLDKNVMKNIFSIDLKWIEKEINYFNHFAKKVSYKNIITSEEKYFSPDALSAINGTIGLAAGNTFKECFVQGFSEILEKKCIKKIFCEKANFIAVNESSIENKELINKIERLKEKGIKPVIFDLSYTFNFPVVCVIFFDSKNNKTYIEFGASPSFYIALERCFTEIYQGGVSLIESNAKDVQEPYHTNENGLDEIVKTTMTRPIGNRAFPEDIFLEGLTFKDFNKDFYLEGQPLQNAFDYYKKLIKDNNMNVWFKDKSLCEQMCALSIYWENNEIFFNLCKEEMDKQFFAEKLSFQSYIKREIDFNKKILSNSIHYSDIYKDIKEKLSIEKPFSFFADWANTFVLNNKRDQSVLGILSINILCANVFENLLQDGKLLELIDNGMWNYSVAVKLLTIRNYKKTKNYTFLQAQKVLSLLEIEMTEEDWEKCEDVEYLALKIIIEPYCNFLSSEDFKNIVRCYYTDKEREQLKRLESN